MKRFIILTVMLFVILQSYSQFFIGYTETEVLVTVEKLGGIKISKGTNSYGMQYVSWQSIEGRSVNNTFFKEGKVYLYNFWPFDDVSLQMWLNVFNKNYVKKDDNTWQAYNQGIGVDIKLHKEPDNTYYFSFTLSKSN